MSKWHWNEERIAILMEVYPTRDYEKLFNLLGTDKIDTIRHKASELKLKTDNYRYTEEDEEFIKNNYQLGTKKLSEIMNRSQESMAEKVSNLGFRNSHVWAEADYKILREVYPHYSNKYISEHYFPTITPQNIRKMGLQIGLHKTKEKSTKWYDKDTMISDLMSLSKKLNRSPLGEELKIYGLPDPKTYARYFGSYKKAKDLAGLETCFSPFGRKTGILKSINGDDCYSKSEVCICDYLFMHGVKYLKEERYSDYCNDCRCSTKRVDWVINNVFVEYFGFPKNKEYVEKMNVKRAICRDCNITLIEIFQTTLCDIDFIFKDFVNKKS